MKLIPKRGGGKKGLLESAVETVGESAAQWASELVEGVTDVASNVVDGVSGFIDEAMESDAGKAAKAQIAETKSKPKRLRLLILGALGVGAVVLWRKTRASGHDDHAGHDHSGHDHSGHDHGGHDHTSAGDDESTIDLSDHSAPSGSGVAGLSGPAGDAEDSSDAGAGDSGSGSEPSGIRSFTSTGKSEESEASSSDDIERIEGIGPKIASLLKDAGYGTFRALAGATDDEFRTVLTNAGLIPAGSIGSWAAQAALLEAGDESGFKDLTDELTAGRQTD